MHPGPPIPRPITYPCTINIDEDLIFVSGYGVSLLSVASSNISLITFIYNKTSDEWTNLTPTKKLSCFDKNVYKYTCAYLRPNKTVIMSAGKCNPVLSLNLYPNSWNWSMMPAPSDNGIIFNIDAKQDVVIYIDDASKVYMVKVQLFTCSAIIGQRRCCSSRCCEEKSSKSNIWNVKIRA